MIDFNKIKQEEAKKITFWFYRLRFFLFNYSSNFIASWIRFLSNPFCMR